ncbi:MAG: sensor histidine kinase [Lachnospiraceae bacterium]|jgi:two-component sensor histidine kinase|nr:MAG: sensor histidine kinase [Lachnospiraceae bacterium]
MKENKGFICIVFINLFLSLLTVCLSPRLDIITFMCFVIVNVIVFVLLILNDKYRKNRIKKKIEDIFLLLHSLNTDVDNYEVEDDEFGGLRDEIIKVISEKRIVTDKAVKNEQILREYTEDIAHQLKTPLTGILLMLDLIKEDEGNKIEYINRIRASSNRLHQLVDILLKLAALDSETIKMKKESISVKKLIDEVVTEMEIIFANQDFTIPVVGKDYKLICDRKWTYEAIYNIVKNGIEASEDKGIKIYLQETNIYQSIVIEDFSKGISKDNLKKIYRRFYKENKDSKGYGIGLPMAKTIIEKQNGELVYTRGKTSNSFELRFYRQ